MVFVCISSGGRQALAPTAETWFSDDHVIIHLPTLFDKPWGKSWNPHVQWENLEILRAFLHHSQAPWWVSALSSWSCWSWYKDASNDFQAPRRRERWITCSRCSLQQYWDIKVSKAIGSTIIHHTKFWPFFSWLAWTINMWLEYDCFTNIISILLPVSTRKLHMVEWSMDGLVWEEAHKLCLTFLFWVTIHHFPGRFRKADAESLWKIPCA